MGFVFNLFLLLQSMTTKRRSSLCIMSKFKQSVALVMCWASNRKLAGQGLMFLELTLTFCPQHLHWFHGRLTPSGGNRNLTFRYPIFSLLPEADSFKRPIFSGFHGNGLKQLVIGGKKKGLEKCLSLRSEISLYSRKPSSFEISFCPNNSLKSQCQKCKDHQTSAMHEQ